MKDNKEYPNYFQASDKLSNSSQSYYLNIIRIDLISMIIAALLAVYGFKEVEYKLYIHITSGIFLFIGLLLTIILKSKKYEDVWYQCRAFAESCKTLTWRFAMCSESFEKNIPLNNVKELFIKRISDVSNEFNTLTKHLDSKVLNLEIITTKMLELRNFSVIDKIDYYIENRIENQKQWYSDKAEWNKRRYNMWFGIIITSQSLALISVVFLIKFPNNDWNFVGFLTTIASSAISWLQIKQHQELKQAYTTASVELNIIKELSYKVQTEEQLSEFVLDSENAISREHTLWTAQKRK